MLAVPVSLIGTLAGLWALNFSLNTLTLFAMTLAIGIVVDDAIVVLENVERIMETEKLNAFQASQKAMKEVAGALVAIVLVLSTVFTPVAFLGGIAWRAVSSVRCNHRCFRGVIRFRSSDADTGPCAANFAQT